MFQIDQNHHLEIYIFGAADTYMRMREKGLGRSFFMLLFFPFLYSRNEKKARSD